MEQTQCIESLSFAELIASSDDACTPSWATNSRTTLAFGAGRLPEHSKQIGWQPVAGPGSVAVQPSMSSSMQSLRQRIVRGEA